MFDNISRVAEQVATSVSRRRFFGAVGRWAGATALGLGGFLTGGPVRGDTKSGMCCPYTQGVAFPPSFIAFFEGATSCPATCGSFILPPESSPFLASGCNKCGERHKIATFCSGCPF